MRFLTLNFILGIVLVLNGMCFARDTSPTSCVSFAEASKHVGTAQCVSGTVLRVEDGRNGAKRLNFCKEAQACPFTVVVFPSDLKKMGDIRQLEGRQIEIKGRFRITTGGRRSFCAAPNNWAKGPSCCFPPCPPLTTSSAECAVPQARPTPRPPRRKLRSRAIRCRSKRRESRDCGHR